MSDAEYRFLLSEHCAVLMFAAMQAPNFTIDPALARVLRSSFARELCRSVEAYLDRCSMSASRFGREAVNDPSFVPQRLGDGRRVKLNTADRARGFMGEQTFRPVLVRETETFLDISGLGACAVENFHGTAPHITPANHAKYGTAQHNESDFG